MNKVMLLSLILYFCIPDSLRAQNLIKGNIKNNATQEAAYAVSVKVKKRNRRHLF